MTYSTLMVHMDLGRPNDAVLAVAADLAERFKAGVTGVAACQPMQMGYMEGYASGDMIDQDRTEIDREIGAAEASFRTALSRSVPNLDWRTSVSFLPIADFITANARSADLVITGGVGDRSSLDPTRRVDLGELIIQLGRPVLVVPAHIDRVNLDNVVVGWRDTRESRRAIVDALPLLREAQHVTVVELVPRDELEAAQRRVADVVAWLSKHRVAAEAQAEPSKGDAAGRLEQIAAERGAGLFVAGAYGHNRLREWVLGGVTRNLLSESARCSLLSH